MSKQAERGQVACQQGGSQAEMIAMQVGGKRAEGSPLRRRRREDGA